MYSTNAAVEKTKINGLERCDFQDRIKRIHNSMPVISTVSLWIISIQSRRVIGAFKALQNGQLVHAEVIPLLVIIAPLMNTMSRLLITASDNLELLG
jgi:hypothetical protein